MTTATAPVGPDRPITLYRPPPADNGPLFVDVESVACEAAAPRVSQVEPLEPGTVVTLHNAYHETSVKVRVNKNGVLTARMYRKACRALCEAELTRDQCRCDGPHGDPDYVLIPTGNPANCEWQICRHPTKASPLGIAGIAYKAGRFTFQKVIPYCLRPIPYVLAGLFVYSGFLLRWALGVCVYGVKFAFAGGIIAFCVYVAVLATAMFE